MNNNSNSVHTQFMKELVLSFILAMPEEVDRLIAKTLSKLSEIVKADRCYIYLFDEQNSRLLLTHQVASNGYKEKIPQHERVDCEDFSWLIQPILKNMSVKVASVEELPKRANTIRAIMEVENTRSFYICPLCINSSTIGLIGVDAVQGERSFSEETNTLLRSTGNYIAAALKRRNTAKAAVMLEQKYRNLFADIDDVVFISTPDGRFLEMNPAGAKLFGYETVSEVLRLNIKKDLYYNPEDRIRFTELMESKGHVNDFELVLKNKKGQKLIVSETATALRDENGNIIAYQGILRDITYRKQLEEQLFQAKKMESVGLLAGGVAHDFNNILTIISGYTELIKMDLDEAHPHFDNLKNILKGVKRAEDLIHQLLAFSRKQMIEPITININDIINELKGMLVRLIAEDIHFEFNLKQGISCIKADPAQIQQILVNLIVNANQAVKQMAEKKEEKVIRVITTEVNLGKDNGQGGSEPIQGKFILLTIQDNGIGMDKETKQNIFEPFFSTRKEGEGTGLGLATVYGIVKQNNGNLHVESEPGQGTTFNIYWPVTLGVQKKEIKMESEARFEPRSEMILYVEDDHNVRELMVQALTTLGYQVIEAENGKIALDRVKKESLLHKIDLVISDIVMPEMNGEQLADTLRELRPDIKILLCSGFTDTRVSIGKKNKQNNYHFLPKPYSLNKLEKTIRDILNNSV
ncbi:MAG: response regulator [bacterium]|nr:MAG: response regulator [bacterium]